MVKWLVLGLAIVVGSGLAAFEPWRAFTHSTIDEDLPSLSGPVVTAAPADLAPAPLTVPRNPRAGGEDRNGIARPSDAPPEADRPDGAPAADPTADAVPPTAVAPTEEPVPVPPAGEPRADAPRADGPRRTPAPSPSTPSPSPAPTATPTPEPQAEIVELGSGPFVDGEHDTSGTARILALADGSRYVRLENFSTSDGPDVYVGLSDAPSGGDWGSYDDDRYVQLGGLKATDGNQNYEIPADVDLDGLTTVVIWCDRFNVAFGTADVA